MRFGELRPDSQRLSVPIRRLGPPVQLRQSEAQIVPGLGVVASQTHGPAVMLDGTLDPALPDESDAEVVVDHDGVWARA